MKLEIPKEISDLLSDYQKDCIEDHICINCNSICCSQGGFALLENVELIYEKYKSGKLKRKGFRFKKGLNFHDFIFTYFDVIERDVGLDGEEIPMIFFHMKHLSSDGHLISIPGLDYWETRSELFERNPWMNLGCIFSSHTISDLEDNDTNFKRHCILHHDKFKSELGTKPIDCVFFTCLTQYDYKVPEQKDSDIWLKQLAMSYPDSKSRLEKIVNKEKIDNNNT